VFYHRIMGSAAVANKEVRKVFVRKTRNFYHRKFHVIRLVMHRFAIAGDLKNRCTGPGIDVVLLGWAIGGGM